MKLHNKYENLKATIHEKQRCDKVVWNKKIFQKVIIVRSWRRDCGVLSLNKKNVYGATGTFTISAK